MGCLLPTNLAGYRNLGYGFERSFVGAADVKEYEKARPYQRLSEAP